jgi:O-antigen/teichoic acid export membrane protein
MWANILALLLLPTCFYLGTRWGIGGIAAGWVVGYPFIALLIYRRVFHRIELRKRDYLSAIEPAFVGTIIMAMAVLAFRRTLEHYTRLIGLSEEVIVGIVAYAAALLLFYRPQIARYRNALALLRRNEVASH